VAQYLTRDLSKSLSPDYLLSLDSLKTHIDGILSFLYTSRPTAVNLGAATRRLRKTLDDGIAALKTPRQVTLDLVEEAKAVADEDVGRNKQMSKWAGDWLVRKQGLDPSRGLNVLTVCNTGSLATSVCLSIFLSFTAYR
jgi:methylthioribose-1-phosphate isomerase